MSEQDDGIIGSMRDDAELMDEIVAEAMRNRRTSGWSLDAPTFGAVEAIASATGRTFYDVLSDAVRIYLGLYAWKLDPHRVIREALDEEVFGPEEAEPPEPDSPSYRQTLMEVLGCRMSRLSEHAYLAGWMHGLENHLPALCDQAIRTGKGQPFGRAEVSPTEAVRLLAFREVLGHWVVPAIKGGYEPYMPAEDT